MDSKRCTLFRCQRCDNTKAVPVDSFTTGYGTIDGKVYCFDCCAQWDREQMDAMTPRDPMPYMLYLTDKDRKINNWPGTLSYPVTGMADIRVRSVKHNGVTYNAVRVWFRDHKGRRWVGVNCEETHGQLTKCRPLTR